MAFIGTQRHVRLPSGVGPPSEELLTSEAAALPHCSMPMRSPPLLRA
jgi:hypothetical protein